MSGTNEPRTTHPDSRIRIGSVPYLNAKPLIYGIEDRVSLHAPSKLADLLRDRKLDVGLVPIVECLAHDQYVVLEGASIACRGPVYSVILAHRNPVTKVKKIAVDPASRSSILLLQVLLRERFGAQPELIPLSSYEFQNLPDNLLLIGDQAIRFREERTDYQVLDLGQAWCELTGLPFVFAAWAIHPTAVNPELLARLLTAKRNGASHIEDIARGGGEFTESFRREYLTRYVRFELGAEEKKGIAEFRQLLQKWKPTQQVHDLRYVTG